MGIRGFVSLFVATILGSVGVSAQEPQLTVTPPTCVAPGLSSVVSVALQPETGWSEVRAYFRAAGTPDYYYVVLRNEGSGQYWATLPLPQTDTSAVELYVSAVDAEGVAHDGEPVTVQTAPVCTAALTPAQTSYSQNLVVGETAASQSGQRVAGFLCDGIVSRIIPTGEVRTDAVCRGEALAKAAEGAGEASDKQGILVPVAVIGAMGAGVVILSDRDEQPVSPSTP